MWGVGGGGRESESLFEVLFFVYTLHLQFKQDIQVDLFVVHVIHLSGQSIYQRAFVLYFSVWDLIVVSFFVSLKLHKAFIALGLF